MYLNILFMSDANSIVLEQFIVNSIHLKLKSLDKKQYKLSLKTEWKLLRVFLLRKANIKSTHLEFVHRIECTD